ncbi:PREDICTED: F-box only protein 43-like [Priapulus caudatus]|uniref:F-box only protein 43-like n=1 Tax=Priapulus caudatus TaxID=37621 RepID=A0ABM1E804_PRICU|nr:PREDICTED: F-box only protein 43-like [Priapulus caudatus]
MDISLSDDEYEHLFPQTSEMSSNSRVYSVSTSTPFPDHKISVFSSTTDSGYASTPSQDFSLESIDKNRSSATKISDVPKLQLGHEEDTEQNTSRIDCFPGTPDSALGRSKNATQHSQPEEITEQCTTEYGFSCQHLEPNWKNLALKTSHRTILTRQEVDPVLVKQAQSEMVRRGFVPNRKPIGAKMGLDSIDFITELGSKDLYPAVKSILSMLSSPDLCRASCVNKTWCRIIKENKHANDTRMAFLKKRRKKVTSAEKENSPTKHDDTAARALTASNGAFQEVQQVGLLSPTKRKQAALPIIPAAVSRHLSFKKEGEALTNEQELKPCPRCNSPSAVVKVMEKGSCTNITCMFVFCTKCRLEFHSSKACAVGRYKNPSSSVCSRKSKKNLKRL